MVETKSHNFLPDQLLIDEEIRQGTRDILYWKMRLLPRLRSLSYTKSGRSRFPEAPPVELKMGTNGYKFDTGQSHSSLFIGKNKIKQGH